MLRHHTCDKFNTRRNPKRYDEAGPFLFGWKETHRAGSMPFASSGLYGAGGRILPPGQTPASERRPIRLNRYKIAKGGEGGSWKSEGVAQSRRCYGICLDRRTCTHKCVSPHSRRCPTPLPVHMNFQHKHVSCSKTVV